MSAPHRIHPASPPPTALARRQLLQALAALAAYGAAPARAQTRTRVLVTLFLRGGADGLSLFPPYGDPAYYRSRPTLAVRPPGAGDGAALKLDATFGMHPSLAPLHPLFRDGRLAVVHGVGSPKPTRSHFDAQDFVEAGTPGHRARDGWMGRALSRSGATGPFAAVALQPTLPRALYGDSPAVAVPSLDAFKVSLGRASEAAAKSFEALYASAVDDELRTAGGGAFSAMDELEKKELSRLPPANGADYPRTPLGRRLQDVARLVRGDVGLRFCATESGGWDTHVAQERPFAARAGELARAIAAFATDLGDRLDDVCLLVMTEFGRTVRENGSRGTDHGCGSAMLVLGGNVRAGRVVARWRSLDEPNLFEGRDVPATIDFRQVLTEALAAQGIDGSVFPGFQPEASLSLFA